MIARIASGVIRRARHLTKRERKVKIISWNVNGIRAAHKKGFLEFVEKEDPDVLCVQETKAYRDQIEPAIARPGGRIGFWTSAERKGYSGVATFLRSQPAEARVGIGVPDYDREGRVIVTRQGGVRLYNIYFPNGGSGPDRHDFKQRFLRDLNAHLKPLVESGERIAVVGDYNVAHRDIDVYDPIGLAGESGFLPEERAWFDSFLALGFVDTFRLKHPGAADRYSWWSYLERGRESNRGWRIDCICVTTNLVDRVRRADILDSQHGSDHCPVMIELADAP